MLPFWCGMTYEMLVALICADRQKLQQERQGRIAVAKEERNQLLLQQLNPVKQERKENWRTSNMVEIPNMVRPYTQYLKQIIYVLYFTIRF